MKRRMLLLLALVCALPACEDNATSPGGGTPPPRVVVGTEIDGVYRPQTGVPDTAGMYRPFQMSYHGVSTFRPITGYRVFSTTKGIVLPHDGEWTTDLSDTIRAFPNAGDQALPSGPLSIGVQCRDIVQESDVAECEVVVNFDPDTRFVNVTNTYRVGLKVYEKSINFHDAVPDTVPYRSWLRLTYEGWDDSRDSTLCAPDDPDRCVDFQIRYDRESSRNIGSHADSGWLPRGGPQDTDPGSPVDSNSANMGSVEYNFYARAVDEQGRGDGTPAHISIVGNFDPVLDEVSLEDHFGNQIDLAVLDTLTWNFWRGVGWPYTTVDDTVDIADPDQPFIKEFAWRLRATGHDHPLDRVGSGVKAWHYMIVDEDGNVWRLARSGPSWVSADGLNLLDDTFTATFRYGSFLTGEDAAGDSVFANLPGYLDHDLTVVLLGRDTAGDEPDFQQYVTMSGDAIPVNYYPVARFGRWTQEKTFTFHIRLVR
jgi:hypothetical protein